MRSKTAPESKANLWQQFKRAVMKMVGMHQPKNMRDAVVDAMDKVFTAVPEPSGKTEYANVSGRTDAAEAFEPKLIEDLRKPEYKSREKLIQMPIDDFLALAEPGDTEFKAENVGALRKAGTKFNSLPFLTAYGARDGELRVEGHEGRHRARALKAAGYETMPVILRTDIRWSEQNDPNKFDYIESWPTRIVAEKGGVSLPMPVSREQAMDPYGRGTYDPNNPDIRYALSPGFERTIDNLPKNKQRPTAQFVKAASDSFSDNSLGEWLGGWIDRNIRTNLTDRVATAEMRIARIEGYAVRNAQNEINPLLQLRQAYDTDKLVYDFFLSGGIEFDPNTRQVKITDAATAPDNILTAIEAWAKDNDMSFDRAYNEVLPKIYEAVRLHNIKEQADAKGVKSRVIPHLPASFIADAVKEYNADPALQEITRLMDEPRLRLLDFGVETGRWTQKDADELKSVVGYVPFDRIMEVEGAGPAQKRIKGGVTSFSDIPTLIGTTEHEVRNVFDNYFNTISFLMSEAVRSGAATSTLRYMEGLGLAKDLGINPNAIKQPARTVSSFVDGVRHFYELPSRQDALAFKYDTAPIGNVLKVLSKVSKVFRGAITMYPTFSGKQLTEDLQRAALTTGVKNVAAVTTKAVSAYASLVQSSVTGERNPLLAEFGKKGLTAEIDWERKDPATSYLKDRGFRQRGLGDPFTRALAEMAHRLDGIAHASDLAVRSAVYSQIKEETGDEARAIAAARELINFRRQGAMESLTYIIPTMPFFNAKLQGLDIEYRAITGRGAASGMTRADAVKSFATRAAIAMAASSLYAMLKAGDDDYENVDRSKRDRMWMLPNGYGIPVPAEYGVIFKMIPEYALEYYRRKGTAEEQAASEAFLTWFSEAFKTYIGQSAPIPQQVKPLLENFVNFSFFTNRPLVGKYLEGVDASEQTVTTTSEGAKYVAKWVKEYVPGSPEVSPIKIDNFVQGYFGSMGAAFSMVLDSFINPDKIDRPLHRVIGLGPFTYEQGSAARKKDEFYDLREDADRAYKTLALLGTQGDPEKYNRYYEKMYPLLHAYDMTTATLDNLSDIRKRVNMLSSSKASIDAYIEEAKARGEKDPRQAAKDARYKDIKDLREFERNEARWVREMRTIIDKEKARLKTQGINLNAKP
jgi:hypothetical protein